MYTATSWTKSIMSLSHSKQSCWAIVLLPWQHNIITDTFIFVAFLHLLWSKHWLSINALLNNWPVYLRAEHLYWGVFHNSTQQDSTAILITPRRISNTKLVMLVNYSIKLRIICTCFS